MTTPLIELTELCKTYRMGSQDVAALRGASLSIQAGEFVAIMGPSGSGKSTLMNVIGLLDVPDRGRYNLMGRDISALNENDLAQLRNSMFGFIFQQFNLLSRTTAIDNVALPLLYSRAPADMNRVEKVLENVGLRDRMEHRPNELSGGQQQRVAIARALVGNPKIILADEPTGNLDSTSSKEIMDLLSELNRQGITIILVTHEPDVARYADRVIHVRDGKIESDQKSNLVATGLSPVEKISDGIIMPSLQKKKSCMLMAEFRAIGSHFKQALRALTAHKIRSLLSMLGILIGVAAVVAVLALGAGAREAVKQQFSHLGSNLLVLRPGARMMHGVSLEAGSISRLSLDDKDALEETIPTIKRVTASVIKRAQVVFENRNWNTEVTGTTAEYAPIRAMTPTVGRFVQQDDLDQRARVAVLGLTVVKKLFGDESNPERYKNPIGEFIKIDRVAFQVIGILPEKGSSTWRDRDDLIIIPLTTAMRRLMGKDHVDSIDIEVRDPENVELTREAVLGLMNKRHRIPASREDAFFVQNMAEIQAAMTATSRTLSWLLSSIAAISLLVGGIGIMNIMLVSVVERTREIGLRKAVGARRNDILIQFLIESVVVSVIGGTIGILLGWSITQAMSVAAGWAAIVSGKSIVLAFVFSIGVGVVFGLWPARKASMLNPIDALRYE